MILGVPGSGGVLLMEVPEFVWGSVKVFLGFSSVILRSIALLADQVLELAMDHVGVKDLVNLVAILILDFDGGQSAGVLAREWVWSVFFKKSDMEHRVEALQAQRQVKLIGMGGDLLEGLEGAEAFMVEFDGGPLVSGSADHGGSAALGESLLGGRDPLALATGHLKVFWTLIACADSW
ncbi:hypothetical protein C0989_009260 [Termitomyces sp. Mn162]|nr:hypothetical protein C0989_009260 [Termitomyces sp. Mn162]